MKIETVGTVGDDLNIEYLHRASMQRFLVDHIGKKIHVQFRTHDRKITQEKRRYFEGALLPAFTHFQNKDRYTHNLKPYSKEDMRELLKREFNGKILQLSNRKPVKIGKSTTTLSNLKFGAFLERITAYMAENEIPIPDPEEYKKWCEEGMRWGVDYFRDVWLPLNDSDYVNLN